MKIAIIGVGNMGGAIARGILDSPLLDGATVAAACPNRHGELDALKHEFPAVDVLTDNIAAVDGAHVVILCVKPWLAQGVINEIAPALSPDALIVSVVNALTIQEMTDLFAASPVKKFARMVPNTAAMVGKSITFVCHNQIDSPSSELLMKISDAIGSTMVVEERQLAACTALASCGIAYVMRFIQASMLGGIELGLYSHQAKEIMLRTMEGAVAVLDATGKHPAEEIERVTTPGGITIRGLNALDEKGFNAAVIAALRASS